MKLVWLKSTEPLSVVIRFITGQDCSHFAFVFESAAQGLMFESDLLGTHPEFYTTEMKNHTLIHSMDLPLTVEQEDTVWDLVVQQYDGHAYNYLGALYLGWRYILKRLFKIPLPAQNRWATPGTYFCDQVYEVLNQIPGVPQVNVMNGMDTPHQVWVKLQTGESGS